MWQGIPIAAYLPGRPRLRATSVALLLLLALPILLIHIAEVQAEAQTSVSTFSRGPGSAAGASPAAPAQGSSPGPEPAPPAPPPPDANEPFIPPANVAVVTTAAELQRVNLAGALDIEIRSHLDLRNLSRVENPGLLAGEETAGNIKSIALLYSSPQAPARSIRGNCSDPDAVAALGLGSDISADLLPLRPRQCLILVSDTWLMVNKGQVWVDNLYLKLNREAVRPDFAFITAGSRLVQHASTVGNGEDPAIEPSDTFLTGVTFHGEHRGRARAVACETNLAAFLMDDCIVTDWAGDVAPLLITSLGVGVVRNTTFRNMQLSVEIADVSQAGAVHFEGVGLANVTLAKGAIVGTTSSDYDISFLDYQITYYAEDDADFDVTPQPVPPASRGVFAEDFVLVNETMSDCINLLFFGDITEAFPGCGNVSVVQEARDRVLQRGSTGGYAASYSGVYDEAFYGDSPEAAPYSSQAYSAYTYSYSSYAYSPVPDYVYADYGDTEYQLLTRDPWARVANRLQPDDPWLRGMQELLGPLPTPPGWPPFRPAVPTAAPRTSLTPEHDQAFRDREAALVQPLELNRPAPAPDRGDRPHHKVLVFAISIPFALLLAAALTWLWQHRLRGRELLKGKSTPDAEVSTSESCTPDHELHRKPGPRMPAGAAHADQIGTKGKSSPLRGAEASPTAQILSIDAAGQQFLVPGEQHALFAPAVAAAPLGLGKASGSGTPAVTEGSMVSVHLAEQPSMTASVDTQAPTGAMRLAEQVHAAGAAGEQLHDAAAVAMRAELQEPPVAASVGVLQSDTDTASAEEAVWRLQRQLNCFSKSDVFLGRFRLAGPQQRRSGGQAVVQYALGVHDRHEYALKFFLDREAFLTEAALYAACFPDVRVTASPDIAARADAAAEPSLRGEPAARTRMADVVSRFLPQVDAVCDTASAGLEDPRGQPLPPCIVMEKGESLQDWSDRADPDVFMVVAVLSNVSGRIADMHAAGYVHRDLKPANVMWLPRENRWTIIDFGCVARLGAAAPVSFTLAYAPPEVALACRGGLQSIAATEALDAWSLGVMAFELLTGAPTYDLVTSGRGKVMRMLLGEEPLPWEGEPGQARLSMLGLFREPVLRLLQREPRQRCSVQAFHSACTQIFAATTS